MDSILGSVYDVLWWSHLGQSLRQLRTSPPSSSRDLSSCFRLDDDLLIHTVLSNPTVSGSGEFSRFKHGL